MAWLLLAMLGAPQALGFELCDGRDDDLDGTLDPDCPNVCDDPRPWGDEVLLSEATAKATLGRARSLAWDGRRYVAVWVEESGFDTTVELIRAGPSGRRLHDPIPLSDPVPIDADPVVDAGSSGYGVAWSQEDFGLPKVLFAHVDGDGTIDAGPVVVGNPDDEGQRPAIVWDGEAYAIAWAWYNARVYLQRMSPSGTPLSSPQCLNCDDASGASSVSIAVGPTGFGVAYDDGMGSVKLSRASSDGTPIGGPVTVAQSTAQRPSVVWADDAWAVAWYDRRDNQDGIYVNRVDGNGNLLGPEVEIDGDEAYSWDPSLVWTGAELLVGWAGADGAFHGLFLRRLDPTGEPLAPAVRLPGGELPYPRCSLVWNGSRPALLRDEDEIASPRPVQLRLVRCCRDADGDGTRRCDGDCDDTDSSIAPSLEETCDGRDDDCDGSLDEGCGAGCEAASWEGLSELGTQRTAEVGLAARGTAPESCLLRAEPVGDVGDHLQLERGGPPWNRDPLEQDDAASHQPAAARPGDTCAGVWVDERGGVAQLRFSARAAPDGAPERLDIELGLTDAPQQPRLTRTGTGLALGYLASEPHEPRWTQLTDAGARLLAPIPLAPASAGATASGSIAVAPRLDTPGSVIAHLDPKGEGAAVRLELRDAAGGLADDVVLIAAAAPGREDVAVTATGQGYLVAWAEPPASEAPREIHVRGYAEDLTALGPVEQLTSSGGDADAPALAFTGEEVVLVFRDRRDGASRPFRVRLDAEGARLGPDTPLGRDRGIGPPRTGWAGGALWTAWTHGPSRAVRPGRVECAAPAEPGLVRGLRLPDESTLRWEPVEAAVYDVVSGELDVLAADGDFGTAIDACEASDLDATELVIPERSLPRFYLVRAVVSGTAGSYDADGLVATPQRDPGIASSPSACP